MGFGDAWEKMVMSHRFNIQSYATSEVWVGLSVGDPTDDGSGVSEPSDTLAYARVKTNEASGTSWQVADSTGVTVNNSAAITFPQATGSWETVTHFVLFSGSTAGASVLAHGALTSSKAIGNGDTAQFAIAALNICLK